MIKREIRISSGRIYGKQSGSDRAVKAIKSGRKTADCHDEEDWSRLRAYSNDKQKGMRQIAHVIMTEWE